jgi:antitoxin (DNA-binding transcriptional repressor) of toxin-antitoxin stability system
MPAWDTFVFLVGFVVNSLWSSVLTELTLPGICTTLRAMSTAFISSREISAAPGKVLRSLRRGSPAVVTANGKPVAILTPTSEATLARDLSALKLSRFGQALTTLQDAARRSGASRLSSAVVNAEIASARKERRQRHVA